MRAKANAASDNPAFRRLRSNASSLGLKRLPFTVHTAVRTLLGVFFEWDPNKASVNLEKHGVRFAEAVAVFADGEAVTRRDDGDDLDEEQFVNDRHGTARARAGSGLLLPGRPDSYYFCAAGDWVRT